MPFQSEKQRRFLHANHPEIAKRWEKEYAHGGILDINESEEIISDDGNDIELTDYNAAFDDPNDLSTGVKTLFQAKDGGTPRRRYFTGAYGGGGADSGGPPGGGDKGMHSAPSSDRQPGFETSNTRTTTTSPKGDGDDARETYIQTQYTSPEAIENKRRRDLKRIALQTYKPTAKKEKIEFVTQTLEKNLSKYLDPTTKQKVKSWMQIIGFVLNPTLSGAWGIGKSQYQKQKAYKDALAELSALGLYGGVPGKEHPLAAQVSLSLNKMKNWNKDDDTGGPDGPPSILNPVTLEVSEDYAQGDYGYPNSDLDRIRAGQAKRAMINPDWQQQPGLAYGQQLFNSGGLANLFRVKNQ